MGTIIDRRAFRQSMRTVSQALFVLSDDRLLPADASKINLGLSLSEALMEQKNVEAQPLLAVILSALIPGDSKDVVLERIDILFDPRWELDVIRLLLSVGRNHRLYILWPGQINGNILQYAQPETDDYAIYDIGNYVDTYIVKK